MEAKAAHRPGFFWFSKQIPRVSEGYALCRTVLAKKI
jgi:hypothetical protein